jgi:hypothetical protein
MRRAVDITAATAADGETEAAAERQDLLSLAGALHVELGRARASELGSLPAIVDAAEAAAALLPVARSVVAQCEAARRDLADALAARAEAEASAARTERKIQLLRKQLEAQQESSNDDERVARAIAERDELRHSLSSALDRLATDLAEAEQRATLAEQALQSRMAALPQSVPGRPRRAGEPEGSVDGEVGPPPKMSVNVNLNVNEAGPPPRMAQGNLAPGSSGSGGGERGSSGSGSGGGEEKDKGSGSGRGSGSGSGSGSDATRSIPLPAEVEESALPSPPAAHERQAASRHPGRHASVSEGDDGASAWPALESMTPTPRKHASRLLAEEEEEAEKAAADLAVQADDEEEVHAEEEVQEEEEEEEEEEDFAAAEEAVASALTASVTAPVVLSKGKAAWYQHRSHGWLEVRVQSVDMEGAFDTGGPTYVVSAAQLPGEIIETVRDRLFDTLPTGAAEGEPPSTTYPSTTYPSTPSRVELAIASADLGTSSRSKADMDALFQKQIAAIMLQHDEDCKRMAPRDAGRLAAEAMKALQALRSAGGTGLALAV